MIDIHTHAELVADLQRHLAEAGHVAARPIIVSERPLGSVWLQGGYVPVPDVVAIKCSYTKPSVTIYEVKADKGDYAADVREDKWRRYWEHCNRFLFAVPAGLIGKDELPDGAGLITLSRKGNWSVVKAPRPHDGGLGEMELLSFLFAKHEEARLVRDLRDKIANQDNWHAKAYAIQMGEQIRREIGSVERRERDAADREARADALLGIISAELDIPTERLCNGYFGDRAVKARLRLGRDGKGLRLIHDMAEYMLGEETILPPSLRDAIGTDVADD